MIGQEKILSIVDNFNINTLPHAILLVGEEGSGQTEICSYVADKFSMLELDLTKTISREVVDQIHVDTVVNTLYTLSVDKLTEKEQTLLLKLYEEPNPFTYIILMAETTNGILETLINRSYQLNLCKYTREQLAKGLIDDDESVNNLILEVCHTPGQVSVAVHSDIKAIYELCLNIVNKIDKANFFNALSISDRINFSDEYSKYDLKLFIRMLLYAIKITQKYLFFEDLNHFLKYINYINDKKSFFENFIIKIWKKARNDYR